MVVPPQTQQRARWMSGISTAEKRQLLRLRGSWRKVKRGEKGAEPLKALDGMELGLSAALVEDSAHHKILNKAGAASCCKTSGKRGMHVYVPVGQKYSFPQVASTSFAAPGSRLLGPEPGETIQGSSGFTGEARRWRAARQFLKQFLGRRGPGMFQCFDTAQHLEVLGNCLGNLLENRERAASGFECRRLSQDLFQGRLCQVAQLEESFRRLFANRELVVAEVFDELFQMLPGHGGHGPQLRPQERYGVWGGRCRGPDRRVGLPPLLRGRTLHT